MSNKIITDEILNEARNYCILFDNGHGTRQYTQGKRSPDETLIEGEWAREMVRHLIKAFQYSGFECYQIVPEDQDIDMRIRAIRINDIVKKKRSEGKQCISISIHINAAPYPGGRPQWVDATGWCGYVQIDSDPGPKGGMEALGIAKVITQHMYNLAITLNLQGNRAVPRHKYKQENFFMCREMLCPAILTENLFMTSRDNYRILTSVEGKRDIIEIHLGAMIQYLGFDYTPRNTPGFIDSLDEEGKQDLYNLGLINGSGEISKESWNNITAQVEENKYSKENGSAELVFKDNNG